MKVQGKFQFLCFSICFICLLSKLPAQTDSGVETVPMSPSAEAASRRTALRCLQLSRNFMLKSEWSNAARQAALGCRYDGSISDLWYIQAESLFRSGSAAGTVLPLVAKAVTLNTWVDNNRDEARLLYARLLSDTTDPVAALEQLDDEPVLDSADAEYLRIYPDTGWELKRVLPLPGQNLQMRSNCFRQITGFLLFFFNTNYRTI